jgi:Rrf2 family protein
MAIVSTKGAYGLTAIIILATSKDQKLLQIKEIAAQGDIPSNYLEQILVVMKKNKIVESIRGANGGYKLARDIDDITVYEILQSLDCCVSLTDSKTSDSLLSPFWEETQLQMKKHFSLTIKELIEFLDKKSNKIMYYI